MKNLKKFSLLLIFIFSSTAFYAQAFGDGKNIVSVGFGFPANSLILDSYNADKNYYNNAFHNYGTVVLKYEHGLHKYFGLGIDIEYTGASDTYNDSIYDTSTNKKINQKITSVSNLFAFYGRLNGHYPIGESLDIFGGIGFGYTYEIIKNTNNDPFVNTSQKTTALQSAFQVTVGARYFIKPKFALFAEVGYALTALQVGITLGF